MTEPSPPPARPPPPNAPVSRFIWPQPDIPDPSDFEEDEETIAMFDAIRAIEQRRGDLFQDSDESDEEDSEEEQEQEEEQNTLT